MIVHKTRAIEIGEVSDQRLLRLDSLINMLQEMAIFHTRSLGIDMSSLLDSGKTWVLSRMAVEILRMPQLEEKISIHTWSRKIRRVKGLRDYSIYCNDKRIAGASTLWLHIDLAKRRPVRVPDDYERRYGAVDQRATAVDIEKWKPPEHIEPQHLKTITLRRSDYDVNGHVNNGAILQFVETAIYHVSGALGGKILLTGLQLAFLREIPRGVEEVNVVIQKNDTTLFFRVETTTTIFASGTALLCLAENNHM